MVLGYWFIYSFDIKNYKNNFFITETRYDNSLYSNKLIYLFIFKKTCLFLITVGFITPVVKNGSFTSEALWLLLLFSSFTCLWLTARCSNRRQRCCGNHYTAGYKPPTLVKKNFSHRLFHLVFPFLFEIVLFIFLAGKRYIYTD